MLVIHEVEIKFNKMGCISLITIFILGIIHTAHSRYQPSWPSLDTRPIPQWFDEAKFGIFIHWGVPSVPAFGPNSGSFWFWYWWKHGDKAQVEFMKKNYPPNFTYADFAAQFTAEFYNPNQWADIIEASGAKYTVLVSKHHDGFTLWPSKVSWNWNAMDVGPKRDLVGELATAIRKKKGIHFGVYHSLFEWFNPLYLQDKANKFKTSYFTDGKTIPELYELVNRYKPDVIWSDGDWEANYTYWKSLDFLAWLYNDSPVRDTVLVNDRWGGVDCKHGDFFNCKDKYNPGHLLKHKWENAMTIDKKAWGYRRDMDLSSFFTTGELIKTMVETISCGGNLLMDVGPTHDGRIIPIYEERLRQVGSWLKVNGEAIYATKPWKYQNDTSTKGVWYTSKTTNGTTDVFAIVLDWPTTGTLKLGAPVVSQHTTINLLGFSVPFKFAKVSPQGVVISIPVIPFYDMPCEWAWVFKLSNLLNRA